MPPPPFMFISNPSLHPQSYPRMQSGLRWAGSQWGRHTGNCPQCSHTCHRSRVGGSGHTHPHLGETEGLGTGPRHTPAAIPTHPDSSLGQNVPCSWESKTPPHVTPIMISPAARASSIFCALPALPKITHSSGSPKFEYHPKSTEAWRVPFLQEGKSLEVKFLFL